VPIAPRAFDTRQYRDGETAQGTSMGFLRAAAEKMLRRTVPQGIGDKETEYAQN